MANTESDASARLADPPLASAGGAFFRARLALLVIATCTALPTPLAPFLGGSGENSVWTPLAIALVWSALGLWSGRAATPSSTRLAGSALVIDVTALTCLLALGGAAQNPFTMLYFVPIALSTLVSQAWTWTVAASAVLGFAGLLVLTARAAGPHAHHGHFFHHIVGMAVALGVAGVLVTYFVHRIGRTLTEQRSQIVRLSREQEQDRFATSLGALAAGAAHELGTPLGTVQLLTGELGFMTDDERAIAQKTIKQEVARMKEILHGMTSTQLSAQVLESGAAWMTDDLASDLGREFPDVAWVQSGRRATTQPRPVLAQILRELVRNAQRSSASCSPVVEVELSAGPAEFWFVVRDTGAGMDADAQQRAVLPFFSTTGGRGLGLFLARVHVRQLGGSFELDSSPGVGTRITLKLPLAPPFSAEKRA